MKTPVNFPRRTLTLSVCAWLFAVVPLSAQSPAPASAPRTAPSEIPEPSSEPTMLSPFQVNSSKDVGYKATNATSGTRLDTPIKDLPMPIEVITADFIRDIGATDLRQSLAYSAGILLDSQADFSNPDAILHPSDTTHGALGSPTQSVVKIRGFLTTETLRNGFNRASPSDSINIERIEVLRGPSALLYGIGNVGGQVNYITKRPAEQASYDFGVEAGTWSFMRGEMDLTGPVGDKSLGAGYRLTAASEQTKDYTDFAGFKYKFISPVFEFHPFKDTDVVLDFERYQETDSGIGFLSIPTSFDGLGASRGQNNQIPDPDPAALRTRRWSGPDTFRTHSDWNMYGQVTQKLAENLTLNLGGMLSDSKIETRDVRGNIDLYSLSTAPANLISIVPPFYMEGRNPRINQLGVIAYAWDHEFEDTYTKQARAELNYKLTLGGTEHDFLFGRSEQSRDYRDYELNTAGEKYASESPFAHSGDQSLFNYQAIGDFSYFRFNPSTQKPLSPINNQVHHSWDSGTYFIYQGKFFSDRLQVVGGLRYDRSDSRTSNYSLKTDPGLLVSTVGTALGKAATKTNPQVGVSYAVTKAVSVYGLYSTGLVPNYTAIDGNGAVLPAATATDKEVGVKIDLMHGRISGTISGFQIDRKGTPMSIYWAPNNTRTPTPGVYFDPSKPITEELGGAGPSSIPQAPGYYQLYSITNPSDLAIIQAYANGQYAPNYVNGQNVQTDMNLGYTYTGANNPGLDQGAYCPVDDQSRGVDMQLIFTPVDNWQIILSYAHTIRKITQGPAFVKYTKGYDPFSLWFIRAESPVDYQGSGPLSNYSDPHDTSTYNRSYAKGLRLDDTPADQGAIWSNYKFKDGTLKGFALGAGATYQGPRDVSGDALGTKPTVGNTALYRDSRAKTLYNAMLAYTFRVDRREWRAQLNAANLLDNQKKYGLNYQTPRSMKVSLNVGF